MVLGFSDILVIALVSSSLVVVEQMRTCSSS